jgi:hypothetical protein
MLEGIESLLDVSEKTASAEPVGHVKRETTTAR